MDCPFFRIGSEYISLVVGRLFGTFVRAIRRLTSSLQVVID